MISGAAVKHAFEQFANPHGSQAERLEGSQKFVANFYRDLGITTDAAGTPCIKDAKMRAHEFSLRDMAISLCGEQWFHSLGQAQTVPGQVFEAGGSAVTPANIPNVSAFLGSVSGLLDARILEGYQQPEFIIPKLIPTIPTKTRQTRLIATGRIGNAAQTRNPGEPHAAAQFSERRVTTPATTNVALRCEVTFEAVYYDQTNEVLERANSIGTEIGLYEEIEGFKVLCGATNNYEYNGVAYNTYLTSGNWINDASNELLDWTNVNSVNELFSRMTDQETGNRVMVNWDAMVVSPAKEATAYHIKHATEVESRTQSAAEIRRGQMASALGMNSKNIYSSPYLDQVLTLAAASGGLALSQTNANKYWFALSTSQDRSAFVKTENWPFTIQRAAPTDYTMLNHKMLLAAFVDRMAQFSVREPRYVVRSKN